jgi:saccharopine dehydrogenase-like NADP-dependent oxidoreductase
MLPWLTRDCGFRGVRQLDQKTLRWPGFVRAATVLADLGLLSDQPVPVDGTAVCPKDVVDAAVGRVLAPARDDEDVTVLAVESADDEGRFRGGSHVVVRADRQRAASGMALLTGTMLAATMTALAESPGRGLMHPWELFAGDAAERLLGRLKRSGIGVVDDAEPWLRRGRPEAAGGLRAGTL